MRTSKAIAKADAGDFRGRFREIVSDPLNIFIDRVPEAGTTEDDHVVLHNGHKVAMRGPHSYYESFSDILVINRGVHEPLEEFVFQEMLGALSSAPSMIELGAYWAHYSMWLKQARHDARVFMVEPETANIDCGRYNFALNGYEGTFVQAMVGRGHLEIDAFLAANDLSHLDILHSDIQGYEDEMLDNAEGALAARSIDYLFISTHSAAGHDSVVGKLLAAGYRVEVSSSFDDTTSHDGFVLATNPLKPALFDGFSPLGRDDINNMKADRLSAYVARLRDRR